MADCRSPSIGRLLGHSWRPSVEIVRGRETRAQRCELLFFPAKGANQRVPARRDVSVSIRVIRGQSLLEEWPKIARDFCALIV